MRLLLTTALLMLPALAMAEDCKFSEPRALDLDLTGIKSVQFEVHSNDLHLQATPGASASLKGRACASHADLLKGLKVTQKREGDRLIVELVDDRPFKISFGSSYSTLDIQATLPDALPVQLNVGSGDAWVTGGTTLGVNVGSGDADIRNIKGQVTAKTGSGDLELQDIGAFNLLDVGSGDVTARRVRGPATVGNIGSGDVKIFGADGSVEAGRIGSGDLDVTDVKGSVSVDSIGSGDLNVRNVSGNLTLKRKGSGDVRHQDVKGTVTIPHKD
jgi:hypothetical protein